jgi:hypothetical protein
VVLIVPKQVKHRGDHATGAKEFHGGSILHPGSQTYGHRLGWTVPRRALACSLTNHVSPLCAPCEWSYEIEEACRRLMDCAEGLDLPAFAAAWTRVEDPSPGRGQPGRERGKRPPLKVGIVSDVHGDIVALDAALTGQPTGIR